MTFQENNLEKLEENFSIKIGYYSSRSFTRKNV